MLLYEFHYQHRVDPFFSQIENGGETSTTDLRDFSRDSWLCYLNKATTIQVIKQITTFLVHFKIQTYIKSGSSR